MKKYKVCRVVKMYEIFEVEAETDDLAIIAVENDGGTFVDDFLDASPDYFVKDADEE